MTDADGVSELKFEKGLGTHASSSTDSTVVFDIAGKGYQRFEGYVGIRYATHEEEINGASSSGKPRSSVIFRVYVDNETVPRFEYRKRACAAREHGDDFAVAVPLPLCADRRRA